jgi:hypothetical protein
MFVKLAFNTSVSQISRYKRTLRTGQLLNDNLFRSSLKKFGNDDKIKYTFLIFGDEIPFSAPLFGV